MYWTRARKAEVYDVLNRADRQGKLAEAVRDVARRFCRPEEEVLRVYGRVKRRLNGEEEGPKQGARRQE